MRARRDAPRALLPQLLLGLALQKIRHRLPQRDVRHAEEDDRLAKELDIVADGHGRRRRRAPTSAATSRAVICRARWEDAWKSASPAAEDDSLPQKASSDS
jgi:hypothetical protein